MSFVISDLWTVIDNVEYCQQVLCNHVQIGKSPKMQVRFVLIAGRLAFKDIIDVDEANKAIAALDKLNEDALNVGGRPKVVYFEKYDELANIANW